MARFKSLLSTGSLITLFILIVKFSTKKENIKESIFKKYREKVTDSISNEQKIDLLIENGGVPLKNIIISTWRSGSTFLGEAVSRDPSLFYHYEPLSQFGSVQIRPGEPKADSALKIIKDLLQCRCHYSTLENYVQYFKGHTFFFNQNPAVFQYCNETLELCKDHDFLSKMCTLSPYQVMKIVRMRLALATELLEDESLKVRLIYLVRDPRGIYQSRLHHTWCKSSPDCIQPQRLCSDLVDDYHSSVKLRDKYPGKIMVVKYEDISSNPYLGLEKVLNFFQRDFNPLVEDYIRTHNTVEKNGNAFSTFRDSKKTPFKWFQYFGNHTKALEEIQNECSEAMRLWGYEKFQVGISSWDNFNPMLKVP